MGISSQIISCFPVLDSITTKGKEKLLLPQFQITWDDLQTLKENIEGEYESRIVDLDDQKSEHATLYIRLPTNDRTATFVACRSA